MRKLLCMVLALFMCFVCFTSCDGTEEPMTETPSQPSNTETEAPKGAEEISVSITEFSGIALTGLKGVNITVQVCEEYVDVLGETVNIVLPELIDLAVMVGSEVRVKIDRVENTSPLTVYAADFNAWMVEEPDSELPQFYKPVIYLYPEADTECSVKVTLQNGELTCTYPEHGTDGWQNFIARPDGTLLFPDGSEYYCLYWEGKAPFEPDFTRGFCVKGSDTAQFLASVLPEMGLSAREANEFIIYWLPILQENPYNLISFQTKAYTSVAELEITPTPDSLLRVYMTAKPMESYIEIEAQTFDGFERVGFTVVEWGGSIIE